MILTPVFAYHGSQSYFPGTQASYFFIEYTGKSVHKILRYAMIVKKTSKKH